MYALLSRRIHRGLPESLAYGSKTRIMCVLFICSAKFIFQGLSLRLLTGLLDTLSESKRRGAVWRVLGFVSVESGVTLYN